MDMGGCMQLKVDIESNNNSSAFDALESTVVDAQDSSVVNNTLNASETSEIVEVQDGADVNNIINTPEHSADDAVEGNKSSVSDFQESAVVDAQDSTAVYNIPNILAPSDIEANIICDETGIIRFGLVDFVRPSSYTDMNLPSYVKVLPAVAESSEDTGSCLKSGYSWASCWADECDDAVNGEIDEANKSTNTSYGSSSQKISFGFVEFEYPFSCNDIVEVQDGADVNNIFDTPEHSADDAAESNKCSVSDFQESTVVDAQYSTAVNNIPNILAPSDMESNNVCDETGIISFGTIDFVRPSSYTDMNLPSHVAESSEDTGSCLKSAYSSASCWADECDDAVNGEIDEANKSTNTSNGTSSQNISFGFVEFEYPFPYNDICSQSDLLVEAKDWEVSLSKKTEEKEVTPVAKKNEAISKNSLTEAPKRIESEKEKEAAAKLAKVKEELARKAEQLSTEKEAAEQLIREKEAAEQLIREKEAPEQLIREKEAAHMMEQRRLEEKTKAEEALERKRNNKTKAQLKVELKAQKEAEEKEKEREKRAKKNAKKKEKKKEKMKALNPEIAENDPANPSNPLSETLKEPEVTENESAKPSEPMSEAFPEPEVTAEADKEPEVAERRGKKNAKKKEKMKALYPEITENEPAKPSEPMSEAFQEPKVTAEADKEPEVTEKPSTSTLTETKGSQTAPLRAKQVKTPKEMPPAPQNRGNLGCLRHWPAYVALHGIILSLIWTCL